MYKWQQISLVIKALLKSIFRVWTIQYLYGLVSFVSVGPPGNRNHVHRRVVSIPNVYYHKEIFYLPQHQKFTQFFQLFQVHQKKRLGNEVEVLVLLISFNEFLKFCVG